MMTNDFRRLLGNITRPIQNRESRRCSNYNFSSSSMRTFRVFFEARIRASSFDSTAVAVTPSGETVTTRYGIPDFGGW